jgi:tetratricopeptide (TPR) repeat protein
LYALGILLLWAEKFAKATEVARECLALFRACGDQQGEADALILLGYDLQYLDKRESADELYEQSLALARSLGDARRQALALFRLGYDRPDRQLAYWEEAIALFRQVDDRSSLASLLCATARFRILITGDIETAQKDLDEASQFGPVRGRNVAGLWEEAAFAKSLIALIHGDYEHAAALLEEPVIRAEDLGNRMGYLWTRVQLGHIALRAGNLTEAHTILAKTAQSFYKDSSTIGVVFTLEGLAGLFVAVGKPEHASHLIGWTDATRARINNPRPFFEQAYIDQIVAACLARMGAMAFWEAYDKGKKMTIDEAVACALGEG